MGITPHSVNARRHAFAGFNACRCNTLNHPLIDAHALPTVIRNRDAWVMFKCTGPHGRVLFNPRDGRPANPVIADPAYRGFHHVRDALRSGEFCGCGLLLTRDCDAYARDEFLPFYEAGLFLKLLASRDMARAQQWRRGLVH